MHFSKINQTYFTLYFIVLLLMNEGDLLSKSESMDNHGYQCHW